MCLKEEISLKGVIGEWSLSIQIWNRLKSKKIISKETLNSKQILYKVSLNDQSYTKDKRVRLLRKEDFDQWKPLHYGFVKDLNSVHTLSEEGLKNQFQQQVSKKTTWGLFQNNELTSIAQLNAIAYNFCQLGGVYTLPNHRRKGYSRSVIEQVMMDSKELHECDTMILFTNDDNDKAIGLYKSLEVQRIGEYALLFGEDTEEKQPQQD